MADRRFTEIDLRRMLAKAADYREDVVEGRWVIETRHRRRAWEVIVEPDSERRVVVVGSAFPPRGGGGERPVFEGPFCPRPPLAPLLFPPPPAPDQEPPTPH